MPATKRSTTSRRPSTRKTPSREMFESFENAPHVCPHCQKPVVVEQFDGIHWKEMTHTALKPITALGGMVYHGMERLGHAITSEFPSKKANAGVAAMNKVHNTVNRTTRPISNKATNIAGYFLDPIARGASNGTKTKNSVNNKRNK